ncbi:hypothetical protein [Benzoatithermus flavus]|uniref:ATP-dependent Clp protease proteolytic subunit n=1 Tax=Benzoatithermus flavus TaxID=3108223 RepID=A0ABU8XX06_9PROT
MTASPHERPSAVLPLVARAWRLLGCLALAAVPVLAAGLVATLDSGATAPGEELPARVALTRNGLVLEGRITPATLPRFAAVLAAAVLLDPDGRTVLELDSHGGNLDAALLMRRLVLLAGRLTGIETRVGAGRSCQSACVVLFAAAPERAAAASALFMFHAPTFAGEADPGFASRIAVTAEGSYLRALAAADPHLVRALEAGGVFDSAEPRFATARELVAGGWRLVTRLEGESRREGG